MPKTTTAPAKSKTAKPKTTRQRPAATKGKAAMATEPSQARKAAKAKTPATKAAAGKPAAERLKPGELDGLVMAYLKRSADSAPHGPTAIARALNRSSGAVGNCLVRLTLNQQVREVSERPRRYSLAA